MSRHTLPARVGPREVLGLAWPVIVSMLSFTLMAAADAVFVGWLGTASLAAIGIASTALFLVRSFGVGLLSGVRIVVAQRVGAGSHGVATRAGWQALWVVGALSLASWALLPFASILLVALGAEGALLAEASAYLQPRLLAAPVSFGLFGLTAWFQGRGDTRTPMVANVLANLLNIALDPMLIFGFGPLPAMGMAGAAWASNLGEAVGFAFLLARFVREGVAVSARPHRAVLLAVARLGAPLGVQGLLQMGSFAVFVAVLARAGEAHLAAHVVVIRIVLLSFLPGLGVANATGVLVGQATGARRPAIAAQAVRAGLSLAVGAMAVFALLFVAVPGVFIAPFDPAPEVRALVAQLLLIAAAFQVLDALMVVLFHSLSAVGDTRFVTRVSVLAAWFVKLPLGTALALPLGLGAVGAWLGLTAEIVLLALVFAARARALGLFAAVEPADGPEPAAAR